MLFPTVRLEKAKNHGCDHEIAEQQKKPVLASIVMHPYHVHNFHEEPVHATSLPQTANTGTWVYVHVSKHLAQSHSHLGKDEF